MRLDRGTPHGARGKARVRDVDRGGSSDAHIEKLKPGPGQNAEEVAGHQQARIHGAMLELVAECGYDAVTVRELTHVAGVSTRSFYKHYSGKEQCFLRIHQLIVRRLLRAYETPLEGAGGEAAARLVVEAVLAAFARQPKAAQVLLLDAYTAGPVALRQAQRARKSFEAALSESLGREIVGTSLPPLAAEGLVAGLQGVVRGRLLGGEGLAVGTQCGELADWALACCAWTGFDGIERFPIDRVKPCEAEATSVGEPRA